MAHYDNVTDTSQYENIAGFKTGVESCVRSMRCSRRVLNEGSMATLTLSVRILITFDLAVNKVRFCLPNSKRYADRSVGVKLI